MQNISATVFFLFITLCCYSQARKVRVQLNAQFTQTLFDRTLGNNPWSVGVGLQGDLIHESKFNPTVDLTADIYLADNKVQVVNPDETSADDLGGVVNMFAGLSYSRKKKIYYALVFGPSFSNGDAYLGAKTSLAFYFTEAQRLSGKISFINIFNRDKYFHKDFGSVSFTLGYKLY